MTGSWHPLSRGSGPTTSVGCRDALSQHRSEKRAEGSTKSLNATGDHGSAGYVEGTNSREERLTHFSKD
jgi:hypothetical protein